MLIEHKEYRNSISEMWQPNENTNNTTKIKKQIFLVVTMRKFDQIQNYYERQ